MTKRPWTEADSVKLMLTMAIARCSATPPALRNDEMLRGILADTIVEQMSLSGYQIVKDPARCTSTAKVGRGW